MRSHGYSRAARLATLCGVCAIVGFSAHGEVQQKPARARIHPSIVHLEPHQEKQFKVVVMATRLRGAYLPDKVSWAVNDIPGGNEIFGTIDANGLYCAPAQAPRPREIRISAEIEEAQNRYLWATVLMQAPGPAFELVGHWGEDRATAENLIDPHCIALDRDGNLLIADSNGSRIMRFAPDGEFLGDIGLGTGEGTGEVMRPRVVKADRFGNIFVSDWKSDKPRIQVFTHEGEFVREFAEKGVEPGNILRSHGIAFDRQNRIYNVDVDNMRVNVYEHDGTFLYHFGRDCHLTGGFNAPHGIASDPNDDLFIVGYYGPAQKFTPQGDFLFDFAQGDPPESAVYFHAIATDRWGNVYLTVRGTGGFGGVIEDSEGNLVSLMKYNNNGDYVSSITLQVKAHSENWACVDDEGRVYVIFIGKERLGVEIFEPR
jgi:hypothetical protein